MKQTESIINTLPKKKASGPESFTSELHQKFQEEMMPILHNLFQKTEAEGTLPNSFYKKRITLIPKQDEDITRKEN